MSKDLFKSLRGVPDVIASCGKIEPALDLLRQNFRFIKPAPTPEDHRKLREAYDALDTLRGL